MHKDRSPFKRTNIWKIIKSIFVSPIVENRSPSKFFSQSKILYQESYQDILKAYINLESDCTLANVTIVH